jgi:uncharacterized protein
MVLEGTVTNVTNFGAFVDLGVHQDGLVHISALADRFIKDPHQVVKTGDLVKVKVMSLDLERKRIALSMRMADRPERGAGREAREPRLAGLRQQEGARQRADGGAMAAAFSRAKTGRRGT